MSSQVTLEQLEKQIIQLTPREQLRLIACVSEQLSAIPLDRPAVVEEILPQQRKRAADELLALCDGAAEMWEGEFDAAEEVRQIRQERGE
jgi:tRNA U54 and U55 pseudouridine synthase Pus10